MLFKKTKSLLIPYLFFSIIALLQLRGDNFTKGLHQMLYAGSSCGFATPMWFVGGLFVTSIVFIPLIYVGKLAKKGIMFIIIGVCIAAWLLSKDASISLPWHITSLLQLGTLFLSGFYMRQYVIINNKSILCIAILILLLLGSYGFFYNIKDTLWSLLCPVAMSASIILLCRSNEDSIVDIKVLRWVSVNGIIVLGAHYFLYRYFHVFVKHISWIANNDWIFFSISFILVYSSLYFIVVPAMNTYGYKMLGKEKKSWKESYIV